MAALTTHYTPHTVQPHTTHHTHTLHTTHSTATHHTPHTQYSHTLHRGLQVHWRLDMVLARPVAMLLQPGLGNSRGLRGWSIWQRRGGGGGGGGGEEGANTGSWSLRCIQGRRSVPVSACAEAFDSPVFCFPLLSAAVPFVSLATFTGVARSWWDPALADDADLLLRVDINGVVQSRDMRTGRTRVPYTVYTLLHILSGSLEIFSQPLTLYTTLTLEVSHDKLCKRIS